MRVCGRSLDGHRSGLKRPELVSSMRRYQSIAINRLRHEE
jgi:hypothetical protein